MAETDTLIQKLQWSLPWLLSYPFWRAREVLRRTTVRSSGQNLIFIIANHFEPAWSTTGMLDISTQLRRLDEWCEKALRIGSAVRDFDGTPFRHTNFYPAEQYHSGLLEKLASLQRDGFGEVEVHLHHGVGQPDTANNLKRVLIEFRDILAEEHGCLSYEKGSSIPKYAFVHGNLALANSAGGRNCGVDSEMAILAETGCYADFTLPSAPEQSQVPRLNAIYQCAHALDQKIPHRSGPTVSVGVRPTLPVIFSGPLVFNWGRRLYGLPIPRIENAVLAANYPPSIERLERWRNASIGVAGKPEWIFIKLSCHGFIPADQDFTIGDPMRQFLLELLELADKGKQFKIHFASAREAFNMVLAAADGRKGEPGEYRDYHYRTMNDLKIGKVHSS
jgi:hypothetical protein